MSFPLGLGVLARHAGVVADARAEHFNYAINCSACHGFEVIGGGGGTADLRFMSRDTYDAFLALVKGAIAPAGIPDFSQKLADQQIDQIRSYIAKRNADLYRERIVANNRSTRSASY